MYLPDRCHAVLVMDICSGHYKNARWLISQSDIWHYFMEVLI